MLLWETQVRMYKLYTRRPHASTVKSTFDWNPEQQQTYKIEDNTSNIQEATGQNGEQIIVHFQVTVCTDAYLSYMVSFDML